MMFDNRASAVVVVDGGWSRPSAHFSTRPLPCFRPAEDFPVTSSRRGERRWWRHSDVSRWRHSRCVVRRGHGMWQSIRWKSAPAATTTLLSDHYFTVRISPFTTYVF